MTVAMADLLIVLSGICAVLPLTGRGTPHAAADGKPK